MRQGDSVYYLVGDHLGTTHLVLNAQGNKVAESRHLPYGEVRWSDGTLPTDYRFTGERHHSYINLYRMGARFYDPHLSRWLSADTLVPDPSNPQSFNRYSWVLGNPLRFADPTGHYTEDEILQAFEVETWDEVLALFQKGGVLEGLWGWLEIPRRANDGDMAMVGAALDGTGSSQTSMRALPGSMGFFRRDEAGRIFVGNKAHSEFAAEGQGYIYSLLREDSSGTQTLIYSTPSTFIHAHLNWTRVRPDRGAALSDLSSAGLDVLGDICIANVELAPASTFLGFGALTVGFIVDLGAAEEGVLHILAYDQSGRFDSGHVLGALGVIPEVGILTDLISAASNLFGVRIEVTP